MIGTLLRGCGRLLDEFAGEILSEVRSVADTLTRDYSVEEEEFHIYGGLTPDELKQEDTIRGAVPPTETARQHWTGR